MLNRFAFLALALGILLTLSASVRSENAEYWADLAQVHQRHGHPDKAIPLYRQAIDAATDEALRARWQIALAEALLTVGQSDEALTLVLPLKQTGEWSLRAQAVHTLARICIARGEPDQAIEAYEDLALNSPASYQREVAQRKLVELLKDNATLAATIPRYEALAKERPDDPAPALLLMRLYLETGQTEKAADVAAALHERNPRDGELWIQRADLAANAGRIDEASLQYEHIAATLPAYRQRACEALARLEAARGNLTLAEQWARKSIDGLKDGFYTRLHLGRLLNSLSLVQKAEEEFRTAVPMASSALEAALAKLELAEALVQQNRIHEAAAALDFEASFSDPELTIRLEHLRNTIQR